MYGYQTPDVYIREESGGARPIQAVGTSTPGFIGVAPYVNAHKSEVVAINNWMQFVKEFCTKEVKDKEPITFESTKLAYAVYGFFLNGGGRCYVVNVGNVGGATKSTKSKSSGAAGASGSTEAESGASSDANDEQGVDDEKRLPPVMEGLNALEAYDDIAIVVAPCYTDTGSQGEIVAHCEKLADRVPILDVPNADLKPDDVNPGNEKKLYSMPQSNYGFGAVYYPWILVNDPLSRVRKTAMVPPSGHIAGVWARTDANRGVHKAPANEPLRGAISLAYRLTREEQGSLNTGGVNCIRHFTREGIRVWGARTINTDEWRYLNVRRLFNMIEESIAESTRWTVFEPNDQTLWKSIRRDVGAFLTNIWRTGALMGATPEEAFFVKCDEETNPQEVIDSGTVITIIGIAPVKPAEFVVFRIRQTSGSESEGA